MTKEYQLVTIITPTYNRADFIEETILSVIKQDYPNIEYIVLDDGSTDNTSKILEKYKGQIIWKRHDNVGEQNTVNQGFQMAKGDLVCFVNSDDPLYPGAIQKMVRALQDNPDSLAAYPDWDEIDASSKIIRTLRLPEYDIQEMLTSLDVSLGPGLVFRRKSINSKDLRDAPLKYAGDLDLYFRLALSGRLIHVPEVLATHRVHASAASTTGKGGDMADQLVKVVYQALDHPNFPQDLRNMRPKIRYRIHDLATKYCGSDVPAKYKHLLLSAFWKIPDFFIRKFYL